LGNAVARQEATTFLHAAREGDRDTTASGIQQDQAFLESRSQALFHLLLDPGRRLETSPGHLEEDAIGTELLSLIGYDAFVQRRDQGGDPASIPVAPAVMQGLRAAARSHKIEVYGGDDLITHLARSQREGFIQSSQGAWYEHRRNVGALESGEGELRGKLFFIDEFPPVATLLSAMMQYRSTLDALAL
jgi:hypothetical protein